MLILNIYPWGQENISLEEKISLSSQDKWSHVSKEGSKMCPSELGHFRNQWTKMKRNQVSHSVVSNSLQPHGLQHTKLPCPSPAPRAYSNSCPSSQWYHPTISSSVVPFFSRFQPFSASGSFQMSVLQIRRPKYWSFSFSISPSNEHSRLISLTINWFDLPTVQGLSRDFSNTTIQKHQSFSARLSL